MLPTESVCTRTNQTKECKKEMQIKENKYEIMLSHTMKKMLPKKPNKKNTSTGETSVHKNTISSNLKVYLFKK